MVKYTDIKKIDASGIYKIKLGANQVHANGEGDAARKIVKSINEKYKLKKHD